MNYENLKPFTSETGRINGKKGGKKAGETKRKRKELKEELIALLSCKIKDKDGKNQTTQKKISLALIQKAINGDVRAFEVIRDTIGEKPTEKQEITIDPPQIIDDIQ